MQKRSAALLVTLVACSTSDPSVDVDYVKEHGDLLVNRVDNAAGRGTIVITHADGTAEQMIASDGLSPNWTPDGRIVFASTRSGSQQIWMMDADGTNARQLTQLPTDAVPVMPQLARNGWI